MLRECVSCERVLSEQVCVLRMCSWRVGGVVCCVTFEQRFSRALRRFIKWTVKKKKKKNERCSRLALQSDISVQHTPNSETSRATEERGVRQPDMTEVVFGLCG